MAAFRIQDFIDAQRTRPIHIAVLAICALVMFIDGFDVFMVGKIAPAIARGFGEEPKAMSLVFGLQQIGLAVGAFISTPMADRFGRRRMLVWSSLIFGALTIAAVFAQSLLQLAILRGFSGIFLSGVLPIAIPLLAEMTPKRRRGMFIAIAMAVFSTGAAASGAVAVWLIDDYGWQSGFWIGGLLPLLTVPLMLLFLPESLQYLAGRNPNDPRIVKTMRRLDPTIALTGEETFIAGDGSARAGKASLFDIFRDGRARTTTIAWLACVLSMGNIALLAAWLPTFFQEMAGIPIQRFAVFAMIAFAGGFVGTLTMGWLMDRFRPSRLIPLYFLCLAASLFAIGHVPFEAPGFLVALIAWNFFQSGGQTGLNTLLTNVYPASMRSTGLGWAGGAGRIGGVIFPLMAGMALGAHFTLPLTMGLIALMPLVVALLVMQLRDGPRATPEPEPKPAAA